MYNIYHRYNYTYHTCLPIHICIVTVKPKREGRQDKQKRQTDKKLNYLL